MAKKHWKVPFCYERYGYIPVEADTPEEAAAIAAARLQDMPVDMMDNLTEYLEESEHIDTEDSPLLV